MKIASFIVYFFFISLVCFVFALMPLNQKINLEKYQIDKNQKKFIFYFDKKNSILINDSNFENIYFEIIIWLLKKTNYMNYGEFALYENEKLFKLFQRIIKNKKFTRKIYIPSGANKFLLIKILNEAEKVFGPKTTFEDLEEGLIFPDTYHYYHGQSRALLIKIMKQKTEDLLEKFWIEKKENFYKTKKEALILASMIEKEAFFESDKPLVASVFLNRLKAFMKLQSDPTAQYANKIHNYLRSKENLKEEAFDIKIPSSLNTYFVKGLPSNPISNVTESSLYAAFFPAETNFLYFISLPGSSKLIFTETYGDHLKNVLILKSKKK